MTNRSIIDVLIVGAGPVGLTLAVDLGRRGIACRIIDREPTYHLGTRARGVSSRTLEIFDDLGIIKQLFACAEPYLAWRFYGRDNQIVRETTIPTDIDPITISKPDVPYPFPPVISQQHTEAVLRKALASHGVHVELGCQLASFIQRHDHVIATVQCADKSEEIQARYLIGCDGGSSTVRKCAGIAFAGETWDDDPHFVSNVRVSGLDPNYWHFWTDPVRGRLAMHPMVHSDTWFCAGGISLDENGMLPAPTLETLQRTFDERAGMPGVQLHHLTWMSVYRLNIRMVDRYRDGRVLLAGDAAHIHSAAGGQGMQTGILDAYNLGWKLAYVLKGAPDTLLDTYQEERLPIAQRVLVTSTAQHRAFSQPDPGGASGVQAITDLAQGKGPIVDMTQLSIAYRDSRLSRDLDDTTDIRAGDRAPDAPCIRADSGEMIRLFSLFRGTHFTLLIFGNRPIPQIPDEYLKHLHLYTIVHTGDTFISTSNRTLVDSDGHAHRAYGITGDALILVRPDGYVGLTGGSVGQETVIDYLRDIIG
ncbi:MAG TPA: FAD-dependent monooxygenase [Ktedonobacteraceae bacterium]